MALSLQKVCTLESLKDVDTSFFVAKLPSHLKRMVLSKVFEVKDDVYNIEILFTIQLSISYIYITYMHSIS